MDKATAKRIIAKLRERADKKLKLYVHGDDEHARAVSEALEEFADILEETVVLTITVT